MLKMMLLVSLVMMRCLPLMCRQAHIIAAGNIISEATSFARQGKHHSKKAFVDKTKAFLLERITRLELATSTLARWRSTG